MLFNSIDFAVFLPIVFLLYWFVFNKNLRIQNLFLVIASYIFYGWWDWTFLLLMGFTTICSWYSGILIELVRKKKKQIRKRSRIIVASNIIVNLLILGFFKYYNFFLISFIDAFKIFGKELNISTLKLILPVGISFYTFQALSYTIDVYRDNLKPTKDVISFFAFVSFFPQLVAGPIERATNLLPQFQKHKVFDYAKGIDGCRQILWGLFKKIVIADNSAIIVNEVFGNSGNMTGSALAIGAVFFAFQIYGDFSGYSDIAIGTARLFGINLMRNFNYPYFSRDIAEFWRKWHISLTTWFRDYIYIPLGGSRVVKWKVIRNTFVIFLVSGFWHGANWTFVFWGLFHALLFLPLIVFGKNRKHVDIIASNRIFPNIVEFSQIFFTFILVCLGWIFFRAETIAHAFEYIGGITSMSLFSIPSFGMVSRIKVLIVFVFISIMLLLEWFGRSDQFAIEKIGLKWNRPLRLSFYYVLIMLIIWESGPEQQFIYFQF